MTPNSSVTDLKEGDELPKPVSQLRESLSTMLTFFVSPPSRCGARFREYCHSEIELWTDKASMVIFPRVA